MVDRELLAKGEFDDGLLALGSAERPDEVNDQREVGQGREHCGRDPARSAISGQVGHLNQLRRKSSDSGADPF